MSSRWDTGFTPGDVVCEPCGSALARCYLILHIHERIPSDRDDEPPEIVRAVVAAVPYPGSPFIRPEELRPHERRVE